MQPRDKSNLLPWWETVFALVSLKKFKETLAVVFRFAHYNYVYLTLNESIP